MGTEAHARKNQGRRNMLKRGKFFTLLELLIVIAIIAILVSILLPALNSARAKGMEADCISKKKQLALILTNYTSDFDDWLRSHWGDWYPDKSACFWEDWYYFKYVPAGTINQLAACSARDNKRKIEDNPGYFRGYTPDAGNGRGATVGLHTAFGSVSGTKKRYKTSNLRRPSVTPYSSDTRGARGGSNGFYSFNAFTKSETLANYGSQEATGSGIDDLGFWHGVGVTTAGDGTKFKVHGGRAVMGFADGHVSTVSLSQVLLFPSEYYKPMK